MRNIFMPKIAVLLLCTTTLGIASAASAQDAVVEDRFKPRVYGSIAPPQQAIYYETEAERKEAARALAETIRIAQSVPEGTEMATVIYDGEVYTSSHDANSDDYNRLMREAESVRIYQGRNSRMMDDDTQIAPRPSEVILQAPLEEIPLFESNAPVVLANTNQPYSISHAIVKGDTLYNLSKRYDVSMDDIRSTNNIYGNDITIGEVVYIPVTQPSYTNSPVYAEPSQQPYIMSEPQIRNVDVDTGFIYAVLPKDTLYSISRTTCTDVKDLVAVNGITNPDSLKPGQRLSLPSNHCLTR